MTIVCGGTTGEGCGTPLESIDQPCPRCLPNFYATSDPTTDRHREARCSLYDPVSDTICDRPEGHDDGAHTAVGLERRAFREAEQRVFIARKHDGKNPYESKSAARRAAKMTSTTFGGPPKMAYRCPVCDAWHVGVTR